MDHKLYVPRILMIDGKIRSGSYPNCPSMAREYEVTERTIKRDIDYMKTMLEAPIAFNSRKKGYYYTETNYFLPAIDITESDFFALCVTEKALRQYENTPLHAKLAGIFDKLRGYLPDSIRVNSTWIDSGYTFLSDSHTIVDPAVWETVSRALQMRRRVSIDHRKAGSSEAVTRTVEPYHMINYRGEWYLVARCLLRNDVLRFAVSRIHAAKILMENYAIPDEFCVDGYMASTFGIMSEDREISVTVRFSRSQAPYILERQWHASQKVLENPDGTVDVTMTTSSLFEIKRWVLSWGADAKVIGPPELATQVRDDAMKIVRQYS